MGLGPWEIGLIFLAILLIFGGKKIPEVARALGKGMNEFKKARQEVTDSINEALNDDEISEAKKSAAEDSDKKEKTSGEKEAKA